MTKSILLADDSATIRRVVELTFGDTEFHVETAASGREALAKLEALRPDLALLDVVMPEPAGYELCRQIKSSSRPFPVLLLAGTFEAFDHDAARACGADGCLLKPFDSRALIDRVTTLLAQRDALSDAAPALVETPREPEGAAAPAPPAEAQDRAPDFSATEAGAPPPSFAALEPELIEAIARAVAERLTLDVVREIAREVVPKVAEEVVRRRIRELEGGSV